MKSETIITTWLTEGETSNEIRWRRQNPRAPPLRRGQEPVRGGAGVIFATQVI